MCVINFNFIDLINYQNVWNQHWTEEQLILAISGSKSEATQTQNNLSENLSKSQKLLLLFLCTQWNNVLKSPLVSSWKWFGWIEKESALENIRANKKY